ncbi:hypothetical protein AB0K00_22550 [Dactylosporangium sp. NPDC049525]|uniref:hypothetical protein n=1 Tax=Dactylosporangium sp. NPDC049525 TaxID=3154730 RepID=UPI003418FDAC
MADADDVRRLALALPHVVEIESRCFDFVDGQDVIVVSFPLSARITCPARTECTRSQQRRR